MKNLFLASSINGVASELLPKVTRLASNQRLLFIPTAAEGESGDTSWLEEDRLPLVQAGFEVITFSLTGKTPDQVETALRNAGSICVAGGNTYFLLHHARLSGFDKLITRYVEKGLVYMGSSAGSLIAGPDISTSMDNRTVVPQLTNFRGFNLTNVVVLPHWGSSRYIVEYQKEMQLQYQAKHPLLLLSDTQYLHIKDEWSTVVSVI